MSAPFGPSPLNVITADERLKETRSMKGVLTGISGIGKTSQLWTLEPERTLFPDLEAATPTRHLVRIGGQSHRRPTRRLPPRMGAAIRRPS